MILEAVYGVSIVMMFVGALIAKIYSRKLTG